MIEEMGGNCSRDFGPMVTHLITNCTRSEKYRAAMKIKKPIVLPEWVIDAYQVWSELKGRERSGFKAVSVLKKYLLKPFVDCVICVTGFDENLRGVIEEETIKNGGIYAKDLSKDCTHLVAEFPRGQKYEYAIKWGILVVNYDWFQDSLDLGACSDEHFYILTPPSTTQPEQNPPPQQQNQVIKGTQHPLANRNYDHPPIAAKNDLYSFQSTMQKSYLQGLRIFLGPGFSEERISHMEKILMDGEATLVMKFSNDITHYITAQRTLNEGDLKVTEKERKRKKRKKEKKKKKEKKRKKKGKK